MKEEKRSELAVGIGLVVFGGLFLLNQWVNFSFDGLIVLPLLALGFAVWGIIGRVSGLFIPAGILAGIGLGAILTESLPLSGDAEGGVFLVAFGAGWFLIPLLSILFSGDRHLWAMIPGGILAFIGMAVWQGGWLMGMLSQVGTLWPLILVGIGGYLVIRELRGREKSEA